MCVGRDGIDRRWRAPSAGLTGCAAPAARSPRSPAALASAPAPALAINASAAPLSVASAPTATNSVRAVPETAPPGRALAAQEPASAPTPASPSPPPHPWKGGEFQRALSELSQWAKKNGGELGAELSDVASGAVLGSVAANTPENPASNQKIVTTAAVLRHLGASFRFRTTVCGARAGDGVPALVLRGSGDPSLSSEDLRALAKTLAQAGIKHVGELLLDQSFSTHDSCRPHSSNNRRSGRLFARQ